MNKGQLRLNHQKTPKPNKTANQIAGKISKNCKKIKQKISKTSKANFLMLNFLGN